MSQFFALFDPDVVHHPRADEISFEILELIDAGDHVIASTVRARASGPLNAASAQPSPVRSSTDAGAICRNATRRDYARAMSQENVERLREHVCEALRELMLGPALRAPS